MNISKYKYMSYEQRKTLATMRKYNIPVAEISETLGIHPATLYRELKRGGAEKPGDTYDPDVAEKALKDNFKKRGRVCA
jgi:IS30 family transposase